MKRILLLLCLTMFPFSIAIAVPDERNEDRKAIEQTALDYIEGWYTKDPERMESALHHEMIKRLVGANESGQSYLDQGSALRLIQATRPSDNESPGLEGRQRDVYILDLYGNAATVKIDTADWVDYLHMVKWNGEWKILNVLWELK